jgi:hypothetical protein
MDDHTTETLELQERSHDEQLARDHLLSEEYLRLDEGSIPWILNHIDCFVSQSRGNEIVREVSLYPFSIVGQVPYFVGHHDDDVWDKLGKAIGNLQALDTISISIPYDTSIYEYDDDDEEEEDFVREEDDDDEEENLAVPDWKIVAHILSHVRQRIALVVNPHESAWCAEDARSLARVIHGHPTIRSFDGGGRFPYEAAGALYSALTTLPALESIRLGNRTPRARTEDESTLANPESLTDLLRVPSLQSICFDCFSFTLTLCQAIANALIEGTAATKLEFHECMFSEECVTIFANGLNRNISVISITVASPYDPCQLLSVALTTALPSNSTLRDLSLLCGDISVVHLLPVFAALEKNTNLNSLTLSVNYSMDDSLTKEIKNGLEINPLSTAIKNGLGMNETLENLELKHFYLSDDSFDSWCRAFSFLHTNKALKSLVIDVHDGVTESCLSAFRTEIVAMLQDNVTLESLSIRKILSDRIKAEDYFVLVTALQQNMTLKKLQLACSFDRLQLTDDEDKHMAKILKKNYALESLPRVNMDNLAGDVGAILRLNQAGRRYLIEDGSSIARGVEVLSAVNSDINCVFLHLLENPRLCDKSAVEVASDRT